MKFSRAHMFSVLGAAFFVLSLYGLGGVLQAASLFTGPRAFSNANLWGSVWLVALVVSVLCFDQACVEVPKFLSPPAWLSAIFGVSLFAAACWFVFPVVADLVAIDRCLDSGGSFDHVKSVCDSTATHPDMSTFNRQGFRLVSFVVLSLWGARCVLPFLRSKRRKTHAL